MPDWMDIHEKIRESRVVKILEICPQCKSKFKQSKLFKSPHQLRYIFFLYCIKCGLNYPVKIAMTKSGRIREQVRLTEGELNLLKGASINYDGSVIIRKKPK